MRPKKPSQRIAALLAVIWISGFSFASASDDSSLQQARELADLAEHGMQTFQPDSMIAPLLMLALRADPDSAWSHFLASQVMAADADYHKAEALRLARQAAQPEGRLIEAELDAGLGVRISKLARLAHDFPGDRRVRMALGKAWLEAGSLRRAVLELEQARRLDPGTARVYAYLAECALRLQDLPLASRHYRSALARLHPQAQAESLWGGLAMTYLARGDASQAISALQDYLPSSSDYRQPDAVSAFQIRNRFTAEPSPSPSALQRHRSISRGLEEVLQRLRSKKPL